VSGRACTSLRARPLRAVAGGEAGFTLLEVLIAAVVLVLGAVGLFGFLDTTLHAYSRTRDREMATNLLRQTLEDARTIPYAQLSPSAVEGELQAMSGLADASGSAGWQIVRGGITYTLTVKECSIDDPKDGSGKHTNTLGENPFCSDSTSEGTADAQPEDLKRVTAEATWTYSGRTSTIKQVQTLTAAGEAPGLNASSLRLESPTVANPAAPVVSSEPASETLVFTVSSPTGTKAMRWSLEGTTQSPAPVFQSGTTWKFEWPIPYPGVSDGTYTISAQAIDKTGVTGPPVSIPVTLIRGVPAAVSSIRGGFNTVYVAGKAKEVAELQWRANTERNVVGYRVHAPGGNLVCPESTSTLSVALSCIDFHPPKQNAANLTYQVSALYVKAGVVLEGPAGELTLKPGEPPAPPGTVTLTPNANGSVTLNWTASKSSVIFYRIYRGSTDYTSRYDLTSSGSVTTYTDHEANEPHSYWVTAVNSNLTESEPVGPVTG
jgi:type II secretory pathway pseudopilin PulG